MICIPEGTLHFVYGCKTKGHELQPSRATLVVATTDQTDLTLEGPTNTLFLCSNCQIIPNGDNKPKLQRKGYTSYAAQSRKLY
jgi:hypothetical protein